MNLVSLFDNRSINLIWLLKGADSSQLISFTKILNLFTGCQRTSTFVPIFITNTHFLMLICVCTVGWRWADPRFLPVPEGSRAAVAPDGREAVPQPAGRELQSRHAGGRCRVSAKPLRWKLEGIFVFVCNVSQNLNVSLK